MIHDSFVCMLVVRSDTQVYYNLTHNMNEIDYDEYDDFPLLLCPSEVWGEF